MKADSIEKNPNTKEAISEPEISLENGAPEQENNLAELMEKQKSLTEMLAQAGQIEDPAKAQRLKDEVLTLINENEKKIQAAEQQIPEVEVVKGEENPAEPETKKAPIEARELSPKSKEEVGKEIGEAKVEEGIENAKEEAGTKEQEVLDEQLAQMKVADQELVKKKIEEARARIEAIPDQEAEEVKADEQVGEGEFLQADVPGSVIDEVAGDEASAERAEPAERGAEAEKS